MRRLVFMFLLALHWSCSTDDSSEQINNIAPGTLTKIEVVFPSYNTQVIREYVFDTVGRVVGFVQTEVASSGTTTTTITYEYNNEGQIWKQIINSNDIEVYTYENGLIISSAHNHSSGNVYNKAYTYNNAFQLTHRTTTNVNEGTTVNYDISYDNNGNVDETYLLSEGSYTRYVYEYDELLNPEYKLYENLELRKLLEYNLNNPVTRIYERNIGTSIFTLNYAYNEENYPTNCNEYLEGDLVRQITYTYQE